MRRRYAPSWKTKDYRQQTPSYRENEVYLSFKSSSTEGIYEVECWPKENRGTIKFHLFHQGEFKENVKIVEEKFSSADYTLDWYRKTSNIYQLKHLMDITNEFNTPVKLRDKAIRDLKHDSTKPVKRVRNKKIYYVYFDYNSQACDNWAETHVHTSRIYITNSTSQVLNEEYFDCDNVYSGYLRYQFVINNFDIAMMEWQL